MSEEIRGIFNRIAPVYDQLNDRLSFGLHRVWKQMTIKWSGAKPGDTCIDLCCGSGDLAIPLGRQVGKAGRVWGVDFSCQLLDVAQARSYKIYPAVNVQWIEADVLKLPFADNFFDAATMGYGLRNVTDIPQALQEIYRVLKPGAKAAILDFHRPENPIVRGFQQWYLDRWVVPAATDMGLRDEYAYISPSLDKFPIGREQIAIAKQIGFISCTHYPIANDMMGVLLIEK